MPEHKTEIVKIERGKYSPYFQVARAHISAASALITIDPVEATYFLEAAIVQLKVARNQLTAGAR